MRLRRWRLAAVAAIGATVLGVGAAVVFATERGRSAARHLDSGIAGRVVIGPTCPAQPIGQACVRPYQATITIRRKPNDRVVTGVRSSPGGGFRIALAPGTYSLVPQTGDPYPRASPQTVAVRVHRYTHVTISYDSGIR